MSDNVRKSTGRSARVTLTEYDLYVLGRALGALDGYVIERKERTVTRDEVHRLWSRIKESEKRLSQ